MRMNHFQLLQSCKTVHSFLYDPRPSENRISVQVMISDDKEEAESKGGQKLRSLWGASQKVCEWQSLSPSYKCFSKIIITKHEI